MINAKIHRQDGTALLAACDAELVGTTLTDGDIKISLSEHFYGEESIDEEELIILFSQASSMNFFGEETITLAIKHGYVDEDTVMKISGIPHVQIYYC